MAFVFCFLTLCDRLRPEAEVSAQVEGALAAEVNSIVLDSLEDLVQVCVLKISIFSDTELLDLILLV